MGSDSPGDLTLVKASTEDDENEDVSDSATRGSDETESGDRNIIVNGGSVLNDTVDNNAKADVNTEAGHAHDTEESDTTETDTTGMDTGSDTEVEDGETLEDTGIKDGAHNSMDQTGTAESDGSTASRGRTKGKKHHKKKKKKKKKGHSKKKGHVNPEDGSRRQRSSSSTAITADDIPDDDDDDSDFDDEAISNECAATESPDEITVTLTSAGDFTGANSKLDEYRSMLTPDKLIRSDQLDAVKSHLTRALVSTYMYILSHGTWTADPPHRAVDVLRMTSSHMLRVEWQARTMLRFYCLTGGCTTILPLHINHLEY